MTANVKNPAANVLASKIAEVLCTTASAVDGAMKDAWGKMAKHYQPLTYTECLEVSEIARSMLAEFSKANDISAKGASGYLSMFARCRFNNVAIPASKSEFDALCKTDDFAKATTKGAKAKVASESEAAEANEGDSAETLAKKAKAVTDGKKYQPIIDLAAQAEHAGISVDRLANRMLALVLEMIEEQAAIEAAADDEADDEAQAA